MSVPVLTAIQDATWEARVAGALGGSDLGVRLTRRCVDLPDLLATAATGQAAAVLLSADLRRLDREALARLAVEGVAVVGLHAPGDEPAENRLRQLGVAHVLAADAPAAALAAAVVAAAAGLAEPTVGQAASFAVPRGTLPRQSGPPDATGRDGDASPLPVAAPGRVVAVWGPTGAPGRTTVAVGLASEAAALGRSALLVDADVYGGVVAQVLGVLDEASGLAAAARLANNGALDVAALAGAARGLDGSLRVLTGLSRADRWPELRPAALEAVLEQSRQLVEVTVVDCGFCVEQDEELAYDTTAPRRNGATLAVLAAADVVVTVGSADPIGLQRLVRALADLRELLPHVTPVVVVNRLRPTGVPGDPAQEIRGALERYAGVQHPVFVPLDVAGVDAAVVAGRTLAEAAPGSPARRALAALAADLLGAGRPSRGRRLAGRR